MNELALPRPDNMRVPEGARGHLVTSDVFNICERIKEIDPNLYIYALDPPVTVGESIFNYSVSEMCADGPERLVTRFEELDARILDHLQYMLKVPFEKRLDEAEKYEAMRESERKENELSQLYEDLGKPMWRQLEHDGFIQRGRSFPTRSIKR